MIAPITSNLKAARFAFTVKLVPSEESGLSAPSIVMVFQMRAIDKNRIVRKIGRLSKDEMKQVDKAIWEMLKPPDVEGET